MIPALIATLLTLATASAATIGDEDLVAFDVTWYGKVKPGAKRALYSCAELAVRCRTKAYLVAGDGVVIDEAKGKSAYVIYLAPNGRETSGWIELAAVAKQSPTNPVPANWMGRWERDEADIQLKAGTRPKSIFVEGYATYGAHDPERIKRGSVNMGELGNDGRFENGQVVYAHKDDECVVRMRLVGPYLHVWDNFQCGGMNVSFRGLYRRATPKRAR